MSSSNFPIEKRFLISLKEGDWESFEYLYGIYKPLLFAFVHRYIKRKEDSEEIVQDVFMKIWEQRDRIDINLSFKSFIFTITKNKITDYFRKNKLDILYHNYISNFIDGVQENISSNFTSKEITFTLSQAINKLPEKRKIIFLLSKKFNLSRIEIANFLNISENTVKNQLQEAIQFLREQLKNELLLTILCLWLTF